MAVTSTKTPVFWLLFGELDQELMCWKEHLHMKAKFSHINSLLEFTAWNCAGYKAGSSRSAQGSKAAQEDSFSHRKMLLLTKCWAHSTAMPSFTSKNQRCWDKWWAVSKCSPMHALSQSEISIILSGQCAKGIFLSKQGHCSGPTHWTTSPAREPSFLYSLPPEPHHCLCQNTTPEPSASTADAGGWHSLQHRIMEKGWRILCSPYGRAQPYPMALSIAAVLQ